MSKRRTHLDDYKKKNKQKVFNTILEHGQISRINIAKETSLSSAAVTLIVDELIKHQYIKETGVKSLTGGRAQTMLAVNENLGKNITFYLGKDFIIAGKVNAFIDLEDITTHDVHNQTMEEQLRLMSNIYQSWKKENIFSISIGVYNPNEFLESRVSISTSISTDFVSIRDALKFIFDVPVSVDRFVNLAAIGESGNIFSTETVCYLNLQHEIQMGSFPFIAQEHIAHMKIADLDIVCTCGKKGCLDTIVSSEKILKKVKDKTKDFSLNWGTISKAYNSGNIVISEIIDESARYLGKGIVNIATILNPNRCILGGDIYHLGKKFEEKVNESVVDYGFYEMRNMKVGVSPFDKQNVLIGGAKNSLLNLFLKSEN